MSYVLLVEFQVDPSNADAFAEAIERHAHNSRTLEEGTLTFDVCRSEDEPGVFVLYEVYRDEQAHEAHRRMPSFDEFFARVKPILITHDGEPFRSRRVLRRLSPR